MKKFFTYTTKKVFTYTMTMMMAITATMLFNSCDNRYWEDMEDREEACTLEGTWTGHVDTYLYDRFGVKGDSYRTTIYFERENSYGGWGYEVDYNMYSRYNDYYYCEFRWEVVGGQIRLSYADSWNDVYIYDYTLSDYYFAGYMDDNTSRDINFRLNYDRHFEWDYWTTRSVTRGSSNHDSVQVSGVFANVKTNTDSNE